MEEAYCTCGRNKNCTEGF